MKQFISFSAISIALIFTAATVSAYPKKDKSDSSDKNVIKEEEKKKKEEEKRLKAELKNYMKNIPAYKAFKEQRESEIDSGQVQLARLTIDYNDAKARASESEAKVNDLEAKLASVQQANQADSSKKETEDNSGDNMQPPAKGTYYKVQLGMFKDFNINKYFDEQRTLGYELVDGMNRYVIGYFSDISMARDFVKDIRRLGIKDAFVAKYIDGVRVYEWNENPIYKGRKVPSSLQDALEMNPKKAGKN